MSVVLVGCSAVAFVCLINAVVLLDGSMVSLMNEGIPVVLLCGYNGICVYSASIIAM